MSALEVDTLKNNSGTKTLAEVSGGEWAWGANAPSGTIIQHKFLPMTDEDATTNTSSFESSGFEKKITLSSASNQVLVFVTAAIHGPAGYYFFDVFGTANGQLGHASNGLGRGFADSGPFSMWASFTFIDTPGTIAEQTYTLYHKVSTGTGYVNVSDTPGYIHLFEIAA